MSRTDSARQWAERIEQQKMSGLSTAAGLRRCRIDAAPLVHLACGLPARDQESQRKGTSPPAKTVTLAPAGRLGPLRFHTLSSKALTPACRSLHLRGSEAP